MIRTGKVVNSEIASNKDGDTSVRMLSVQMTDGDDVQSVEYYDDGGSDYRPPDGAEVVVIDVSPSHRVAIAVDDLLTPAVSKGEKEIYSTDTAGTAKAATVLLKNDGTIEILDNTDFAVRYGALETKLAELESNLNALKDDYNAHAHGIPPLIDSTSGAVTAAPPGAIIAETGVSAANPPNGATSSVDFTPARIDEIKVPA